MLPRDYVTQLCEFGRAQGLDAVGVAPAHPFDRARRALEARKAAGLHAGMAFTYKNPARSSDPGAAVRGANAVVVGARAYPAPAPAAAQPGTAGPGGAPSSPGHGAGGPPGGPAGRVAAYAVGDHYGPLREALWAIARRLRADGWKAVAFADDNSLVDREAAWLGGLGWFGKNANLLVPGHGSWFVLGGVVTDAPLPAAAGPVPDGCGPCHRCIDACPTHAIVAPGVVDARRCLAWLLQAPGSFPLEHRRALGDRFYGCDDCQEVCPPSRGGARGPGAAVTVDVLGVLEATDEELLASYGRWYLWERDPRWWRRNALVILGNVGHQGDRRTMAVLERYRRGPDPLLAEHAAWAIDALGQRHAEAHRVGSGR